MRRQLRDESGVALSMAVVILAFLMAAGTTLVYYTSANSRHAEQSKENARALNLAEAGMNYARSILWAAADPSDPDAVQSGSLTLEGGTVTYSGTYDAATQIWTLTGTGTYTNPTAGSTHPVSRTASSQVIVSTMSTFDPAWGYLFADSTDLCTNLRNSIEVDAPVYVRGDLCMENSAVITGELVRVRGKVDIKDVASIGTVLDRVQDVEVGTGCSYPWNVAYLKPCGDLQRVYRVDFASPPPDIAKPTVDLNYWYSNAKPGPTQACTSGSFPGQFDTNSTLDRSNGTQYLFSASSYDCTVTVDGNVVGRIAYTPGFPGTLTISGVIFFDGKLELPGNRDVVYSGRGVIYASDVIKIQNYVRLCGVADCSSGSWDPDTNLLVFVGGATADDGFIIENHTAFQGAIYVVNDYIQKNNVTMCGPVIAQELKIENGSQNCYVPFSSLPDGAPGSSSGASTLILTNVDDSFTTD
jgi:hypothetical protein